MRVAYGLIHQSLLSVGYHWSHLWQVLLGLVRFLISHYERIATEGDVDELLQLASIL